MPVRNKCCEQWLHGKFKGCGYKVTTGRQAILDILHKANKHLSAEDIYLKVHNIYPAAGLTTVYRTLEILEKMGMIYRFYRQGSKAFERNRKRTFKKIQF